MTTDRDEKGDFLQIAWPEYENCLLHNTRCIYNDKWYSFEGQARKSYYDNPTNATVHKKAI